MKIAVTGLPNSGKTTMFNALTGLALETTLYPSLEPVVHRGIVKVTDQRIDTLSKIFIPHKTTYAAIEYMDLPGLSHNDRQSNTLVFDILKDVDAVVHIIRAFQSDAVIHPMEHVDVIRDAGFLRSELIFGDYAFVEKRLERMEEASKRGKKFSVQEKELLLKCSKALEQEIPLRNLTFTEEEHLAMRPLQFLTTEPEIFAVNIDEQAINTDYAAQILSELQTRLPNTPVIVFCAKVEMEIAQLPPDESKEFLNAMGIEEPALSKLIRMSYSLLQLISFFTVGKDEVRAWPIQEHTTAQKAAGKVHSDIERGFIRAEVVSYEDFMTAGGSMHVAKEAGKVRLEGKTYLVQDGDIINFRFHV